MQWNDVIHVKRLEAGLTRPQLARMVGVHRIQIWKWEQGTQSPYLRNAVLLAQVLGVEVEDIRRPKEEKE